MRNERRAAGALRKLERFGLALAIGFLYLYSFPYFPGIHSANELPRIYLTRAMVEDGSFAIDSGIAKWGSTVDVSEYGGRHFSNKAPGSSFVAVPAYLAVKGVHAAVGGEPTLGEIMWSCRFFAGIVPTLLFLVLLSRFLTRFCPEEGPRRLAVAGYALGSMAMTYSVLFIAHQLSAICIASAYILCVKVLEDEGHPRWLVVAGFLAGAAPLCDYQAAFAGVPVAVYVVWKLFFRSRHKWRGLVLAAAGAVVPIALLLFYHWCCFGSPLRTGYNASKTFAHFHQQGFLGLTGPTAEAFVGSMVSPDNGLLFLCPMVLLAVGGWVVLGRKKQWWPMAISLAVCAIYIAFISSLNFWRGGWGMGPRYITAMLPFVMIPVAAAISWADERPFARAGCVALVVVGICIYALSCAMFPHFPEDFKNPVFELTARLWTEGYAPYNAGWFFGLRGLASLIPVIAVLAAAILWVAIPNRRRILSGAIGLAIAAGILGAYARVPGGGAAAEHDYQFVKSVMPTAPSQP